MLSHERALRVSNNPEAITLNLKTIESEWLSTESSRIQYIVRLVLTELMSNAFRHGNQEDPSKWIELKVTVNKPYYTFEVTDEGLGFSLPDFTKEHENVSESGRGLRLIHDLSESFESVNQGKTLKVILKLGD